MLNRNLAKSIWNARRLNLANDRARVRALSPEQRAVQAKQDATKLGNDTALALARVLAGTLETTREGYDWPAAIQAWKASTVLGWNTPVPEGMLIAAAKALRHPNVTRAGLRDLFKSKKARNDLAAWGEALDKERKARKARQDRRKARFTPRARSMALIAHYRRQGATTA